VRVLSTDLHLHGRRFVLIEFSLVATMSVALCLIVAGAAVIRGSGATNAAIGFVFFAGVAINSLAVTGWIRSHGDDAYDRRASVRDLTAFAAATLVPGALVLALRS
jgi:hypothetical protein